MIKAVIIGSYGHYAYALDGKLPVEFAAVAPGVDGEPTDELIRAVSDRGKAPKLYADALRMLDEERPDIVIINSRMDKNAFYSIEAMKRGASVFCEKPAATTIADLDRLIQTYNTVKTEKPDILYVPMFGITSEPPFYTAKCAIDRGAIGEVRLAYAQKSYKLGTREPFYSSRDQLGGMIPWVAVHGIDWLYTVCGFRFQKVFAAHSDKYNGGNGTLESSAVCTFTCDGGAIGTVSADYFRPASAKTHGDDRLRAVGTRGVIEVRGGKTYIIDKDGERELPLETPPMLLFDGMISEMLGTGRCPSDAETAFRVTCAALLARESADTGKIAAF